MEARRARDWGVQDMVGGGGADDANSQQTVMARIRKTRVRSNSVFLYCKCWGVVDVLAQQLLLSTCTNYYCNTSTVRVAYQVSAF